MEPYIYNWLETFYHCFNTGLISRSIVYDGIPEHITMWTNTYLQSAIQKNILLQRRHFSMPLVYHCYAEFGRTSKMELLKKIAKAEKPLTIFVKMLHV